MRRGRRSAPTSTLSFLIFPRGRQLIVKTTIGWLFCLLQGIFGKKKSLSKHLSNFYWETNQYLTVPVLITGKYPIPDSFSVLDSPFNWESLEEKNRFGTEWSLFQQESPSAMPPIPFPLDVRFWLGKSNEFSEPLLFLSNETHNIPSPPASKGCWNSSVIMSMKVA